MTIHPIKNYSLSHLTIQYSMPGVTRESAEKSTLFTVLRVQEGSSLFVVESSEREKEREISEFHLNDQTHLHSKFETGPLSINVRAEG